MAVHCPRCQTRLSPWGLRKRFACPLCRTPLSANVTTCVVLAFLLWAPFDFLLVMSGVHWGVDSWPVFFVAYALLSAALLFGAGHIVLSNAKLKAISNAPTG